MTTTTANSGSLPEPPRRGHGALAAARAPWLGPVMAGAVAGLAGSLVMSAYLWLFYHFLPRWQRYANPPHEITIEMARRVGLKDEINQEPAATLATAAGHLGYGMASGALYSALMRSVNLPWGMKGLGFGLFLWASSYLGWIPAFEILSPATKHPRQRVIMMISAHEVWGATVAGILHILIETREES